MKEPGLLDPDPSKLVPLFMPSSFAVCRISL